MCSSDLKVVEFCPNAIIIPVANPLDAMAQALYKLTKFPRERILGMAGVLDSARFRHFLAEEFNVSTDAIVEKLLRAILIHHGETARQVRGVVLQDYLKGRMTETDFVNGLIARKGRAAGVPTPANDAVVEVNRRIRAGELKPERSNIAIAHQLAGT